MTAYRAINSIIRSKPKVFVYLYKNINNCEIGFGSGNSLIAITYPSIFMPLHFVVFVLNSIINDFKAVSFGESCPK